MKTNVLSISALVIGATLISLPAFAFGGGGGDPTAKLSQMPYETLSIAETESLTLMAEEEKLAHDVYLELFDKWDSQIFYNIATRSETKHIEIVKALLNKYSISDSALDNSRGIFANEKLQNLYNDLVSKGSVSLVEALKVGATIEDLDIYDLREGLSVTDNEDIIWAYEKLEKGSRNHLRAFNRQLEQNSANYSAQYLTQEEYDKIAYSEQEKGKKNGDKKNCDKENDSKELEKNENFSKNPRNSRRGFSQRGKNSQQARIKRNGRRSYQFSNKGRNRVNSFQDIDTNSSTISTKNNSSYFDWFRIFRFFRR